MIELDIEQDASINPEDLDLEWRQQAHIFSLYAKAHSDAIRDEKRIKADLANEYRKNTPGKISSSALKDYIDADDEYIEANHKKHEMEGCIEALKHKKQALENLVQLAKMDWFSSPTTPKDLSRSFEKRVNEEKTREKIHEKLNGESKRRRTK